MTSQTPTPYTGTTVAYSLLLDYSHLADSFAVNAGDSVYIRVGTESDHGGGGSLSITPSFHYTSFSDSFDANGLSNAYLNL